MLNLNNNYIRVLGGFAPLKRLDTLLLSKNRITQIANNFHDALPNLKHLILNDNALKKFYDLEPLFGCKTLETLVLRGNPVVKLPHYKELIVHRLPHLHMLDYERIGANVTSRPSPRKEIVAHGLLGSESGQILCQEQGWQTTAKAIITRCLRVFAEAATGGGRGRRASGCRAGERRIDGGEKGSLLFCWAPVYIDSTWR